uniref:NADH dehydrogenase [ubiquinone] 1 alpha subcomplex subunit 11 n=1 Tax=Chelydra serpentina TaxID=8475 RepID=A0A8C3TK77_CHESE
MAGYWEIPEGTDCARKAWITGRLGAALGLIGSAYHIILIPPESAFKAVQTAATSTVTMAHSYVTGSSACVGLGLLAAFTKIGKREGWRIGPPKL